MPTGKRPLGRLWRGREDNIRMDLEEIYELLESPSEYGIEPPGFISHRFRLL